MGNKTQILCNRNNKTQLRLMKFHWQRIKLEQIQLLKSKVERKDLIKCIIEIRKRGQREYEEIVKLVRVLKRIRFIKERIIKINEWRLECIDKLIIC